jgi:hypothetical protein
MASPHWAMAQFSSRSCCAPENPLRLHIHHVMQESEAPLQQRLNIGGAGRGEVYLAQFDFLGARSTGDVGHLRGLIRRRTGAGGEERPQDACDERVSREDGKNGWDVEGHVGLLRSDPVMADSRSGDPGRATPTSDRLKRSEAAPFPPVEDA